MGLNNVWFKICCSVGLKGAVQRFGLFAELSSEFLLFVRTLIQKGQPRSHRMGDIVKQFFEMTS